MSAAAVAEDPETGDNVLLDLVGTRGIESDNGPTSLFVTGFGLGDLLGLAGGLIHFNGIEDGASEASLLGDVVVGVVIDRGFLTGGLL